MRRIALLLFVASAATASPFRHERNVTPGGPGANRLDVDVTLLAGAAPDLRDLRLYSKEREVGYLLVEPKGEPRWIDGRMLPIAATRKSSGFEVDLGRGANVDRLKIEDIAPPFLKRATIEGSGDRKRWTLLADATVFNLPDSDLHLTEVAFTPGEYRYLRVMWDDRSSAPVSANSVRVREHDSAARPEPLRFETAFAKRASEPGRSRYRINLPGPHLPVAAIEVDVASGDVFRSATVTEPRLGNGEVIPANLGSATLKRAEREGIVAAQMSIDVAPPQGRELDLVIEDGNNPPLAITAIRARLKPQPWIYFESDGSPLRARYGASSLNAPLYDIEASRPYVAKRAVARAAWGGITNPAITRSTAPEIPLGGALDRGKFRVRRRLPNAPEGLTVLVLDAHVLARDTYGLSDVRIADDDGRQVPYLVEQRAEPLVIDLHVPNRTVEGSTSVYRIALPYEHWPQGTRLVLTTSARVFERNVVIRDVADSHRKRRSNVIDIEPWRTADPELLPPPLSFGFGARRTRTIELVIDEGDNAPLPLRSAQLLLPSYALRFHHPGTPLDLLYGNRRAGAPRYDIALLGPRLFGEPAREITLPPYGASEPEEGDASQRKLFWAGIIVAAVVLIALLLKLLLVSPETSRAPSDST